MRRGTWSAIIAASMVSGSVFGAGFQLYTEGSAEALGQAGAISGRTNLVSLAWYNPSALAGTESPSIMLGSTFVQVNTDYVESGNNASMSDEWRVVPHFYYVQPVSEDWTAMLSVNAPYGLITEWSDDWAGAMMATYSELRTVYITPSVAYRISEKLAVSAGMNVVDAKAELKSILRTVEGEDLGYGYTASAHYAIAEDWAMGARYQSKVDLKIDGSNSVTGPAQADLTLPSTVNAGVVNTTFDNLSVGLDLVWTEWSTYDTLDIGDPTGPVSKDWDDVWSVRLGGEYVLGESWALRAGYVWDQSPVPDSTRSPELPGSDRQMLMGGFGWKWNQLTIDAAYSYLWADTAEMGANPLGLTGEFQTTTHLISLSVSYMF